MGGDSAHVTSLSLSLSPMFTTKLAFVDLPTVFCRKKHNERLVSFFILTSTSTTVLSHWTAVRYELDSDYKLY